MGIEPKTMERDYFPLSRGTSLPTKIQIPSFIYSIRTVFDSRGCSFVIFSSVLVLGVTTPIEFVRVLGCLSRGLPVSTWLLSLFSSIIT